MSNRSVRREVDGRARVPSRRPRAGDGSCRGGASLAARGGRRVPAALKVALGAIAALAAIALCALAFNEGLLRFAPSQPSGDSGIENDVTSLLASDAPMSDSPQIEPFVSSHDEDGDGVDDQTDVLRSAEAYVATEPEYKSAYYAQSGYPDDGFGVCADVIAFALLGAGYDLQALMDADIRANPEAYGIEQPDAAIDFRRTNNQKVYFDRNAVSLTLDTSRPEEWQGGDIVMFDGHVGIASSRRNEKGLPYLIHHYSSNQESYEEDALELWGPIVGHYRMSE